MLKQVLQRGGLVVIIPVVTMFLGAILSGLYGAFVALDTVVKFFTSPEYRETTTLILKFFTFIDVFLLSMVLYIFSLGLYELFVGKLNVPESLRIESVDELKAKLASVIVLFVAIAYVKELVYWQNAVDTLLFGVATGILLMVLIQYYKVKEGH